MKNARKIVVFSATLTAAPRLRGRFVTGWLKAGRLQIAGSVKEPSAILQCTDKVHREDSYRPRQPRQPEQTVLYQVIAENLETFLARERGQDRNIPDFIEREFRKFLECGIAAHGFLRLGRRSQQTGCFWH